MKFGMEITKYATINKYTNVYSKDKKINGKSKRCWFGVKKVEETYVNVNNVNVNSDDVNSDDGTDIIY